jgi:hypothetical protein
MADADILVNTVGTGTKVDTRTVGAGTDEHRQVMVIGDPATAANVTAVVAKSTQGAFAVATQDLKDSGRVSFVCSSARGVAGVTSEALMTLTPVRDGVAGGTFTTGTITSGKRFRITALIASVRASAAVATWAAFTVRFNPSGAATATSPVILQVEVGTPTQVIGATQTVAPDIPDGIELFSAGQFGISHIAAATTVLETVSLVGYEY